MRQEEDCIASTGDASDGQEDASTDVEDELTDQALKLAAVAGELVAAAKEPAETRDERQMRRNATSTATINFRAQVKHLEQAVKNAVKEPEKTE